MNYQGFRNHLRRGEFEEAEALLQPDNETTGTNAYWALLFCEKGDFDKAEEISEELYTQSIEDNNWKDIIFNGHVYCHVLNQRGKLQETKRVCQYLISLTEKCDIEDDDLINSMGYIHNSLGNVIFRMGGYDTALSEYHISLGYRELLNDPYLIALSLGNIAIIHNQMGKYNQAEEFYLKSLQALNEGMYIYESRITYNNLGVVYLDQGRLEEAEEMLKKSIKISEEFNDRILISVAQNNIGLVNRTKGNLEDAKLWFLKAFEMRKDLASPFQLAYSYYYLSQTHTDLYELKEAKFYTHKLKDLADKYPENRIFRNQFNMTKALILQRSSRQSQKYMSKQIFENIYHDTTYYDNEFKITAIFKLCEFLLDELKEAQENENSEEEDQILQEINDYVDEMTELSQDGDLVVRIQIKYLQSYLALSNFEVEIANSLLQEAEDLATTNGIHYFTIKPPSNEISRQLEFSAGNLETNISINKIIHSLPKLKIIFYLFDKDYVSFMEMKNALDFSPGNLGKHCDKLANVGYIEKTKKTDDDSKFVTVYRITSLGINEFRKYADHLKHHFKITEII